MRSRLHGSVSSALRALPFTWHDEQASARHREITAMMAQTLGRFVEASPEECSRRARYAFALVTGISRTRALYGDVLPNDEATAEVLAAAVLTALVSGLERKAVPDGLSETRSPRTEP